MCVCVCVCGGGGLCNHFSNFLYEELFLFQLGCVCNQEIIWRDTLADDNPNVEQDVRQGGLTPTEVNPKLYHDVQTALSRLVGKLAQLIANRTTNLAECWMHIRTKFDGGKVINGSQSGSWELRCMGAGLQQNMGRGWGPKVWKQMAQASPNKVYEDATDLSVKRVEKDRKRKATEEAKGSRRRDKYMRKDDSTAARRVATDMTKAFHLMKFLTMFLKSS